VITQYLSLEASEVFAGQIELDESYFGGVRKGKNHINGIENFWNQSKRVLRKYNGIDKKSFPLFLKECEFRFNYGTPKTQLKTLRLWCNI